MTAVILPRLPFDAIAGQTEVIMSATLATPAAEFIEDGLFSATALATALRTTKAELADTLGLSVQSLSKPDRVGAPKVQTRLREFAEVMARMAPYNDGLLGAYAWFRSYPLEGCGGLTAAELTREGEADVVAFWIDDALDGGYA